MADDDVTIRMRLQGALKTAAETRKVAGEIDNLGDQAKQAARKLRQLNAESKNTRISLGPFSTSARVGILALGAFANAAGPATAGVIGLTEALATAAGGTGAAAGVGLVGFAQGMGVVKLATQNVTQALSGNKKALAALSPEQRGFVDQLNNMRPLLDRLRGSASGGLLGGLAGGAHAAAANFGIVNRIVRQTSGTLGGLARQAGGIAGSRAFGADLNTVGGANVRIIDNLGHATLNLAGAAQDLLVEAAPLAEWLSRMALRGSKLVEVWIANERATGGLSRFFRRARTDLTELASIGGHTGRGILNLFGAQDISGTRTLASLDRVAARFERWTRSPAVRHGVGQAIIDGIGDLGGKLAEALAHQFLPAGATAGRLFVRAFFGADVWGKALIAGIIAKKLGAFGAVGKLLAGSAGGKAAGVAGKLLERGATPANPLFVVDVASAGGKSWIEKLAKKAEAPAAGAGAGLASRLLRHPAGAGGAAAGTALALSEIGSQLDRHALGGGAGRARAEQNRITGGPTIFGVHPRDLPVLGGLFGGGDKPRTTVTRQPIVVQIAGKPVARAVVIENERAKARK